MATLLTYAGWAIFGTLYAVGIGGVLLFLNAVARLLWEVIVNKNDMVARGPDPNEYILGLGEWDYIDGKMVPRNPPPGTWYPG